MKINNVKEEKTQEENLKIVRKFELLQKWKVLTGQKICIRVAHLNTPCSKSDYVCTKIGGAVSIYRLLRRIKVAIEEAINIPERTVNPISFYFHRKPD
jgi:hypothetical protein